MSGAVLDQIEAAIAALETEEIVTVPRDEMLRLERLRIRFDAQVARRLGAFDATYEWAADNKKSLAHWLRSYCNAGKSAYSRASVAKQVRSMPLVEAAWRAGRITSEHVALLARVRRRANADDRFAEFEATFVDAAKHLAPEDVAGIAGQWRDALDAEREPEATEVVREYESRSLSYGEILDGVTVGDFRLDREAGSYLRRAIDIEYARHHTSHDSRGPEQQRADALTSIMRKFLAGATGGSSSPHVLFLADHGTFDGDHVGLCETDRGVRISPETLRRISCDANVATATIGAGGEVLDLGRAVRNFTAAQRRALIAQYPTCVGLNCPVPASDCEMHHLDWWEHDGPTDLGNGAPLCWHEHHLVHELGYSITRDPVTGIVEWYDPDGNHLGTSHPRVRPKPIPTPESRARLRRAKRKRDPDAA